MIDFSIDMSVFDVKYDKRAKTFTVRFRDPGSNFIPTSCYIRQEDVEIAFAYLVSVDWDGISHNWVAKYVPFEINKFEED